MNEIVTAAQESWANSERVRKAAPDMLAALEAHPDPWDYDNTGDYTTATSKWWDELALPAIEKAKGERS